jgi:hypothetical protein
MCVWCVYLCMFVCCVCVLCVYLCVCVVCVCVWYVYVYVCFVCVCMCVFMCVCLCVCVCEDRRVEVYHYLCREAIRSTERKIMTCFPCYHVTQCCDTLT